jgi:hypothetical protein
MKFAAEGKQCGTVGGKAFRFGIIGGTGYFGRPEPFVMLDSPIQVK